MHRMGTYLGGAFNFLDQNVFRGKLPFTLKDHSIDSRSLRVASDSKPITYPSADGILSFDKNSSVFLTNTNHEEDQPVHLCLEHPSIPLDVNLPRLAEPAQRHWPPGVHEIPEDEAGSLFQTKAQNRIPLRT